MTDQQIHCKTCGCLHTPGRHITLPSAEVSRVEPDSKTTQPSVEAVEQAKAWVEQGSKL
ncbi:MAG: DUF3787 domain-containing protein [Oscillospiraceae bacterium]|nr:DUF3787 domain-containing protein [Oscillospiraceae bacterium]